jgi:Zn-finger nucleic acid-binding protein
MDKILCGTDKLVLIDKCRKNDGLWFDRGELDTVVKIGSFDKESKIVGILESMFGSINNGRSE